MKYLFLICAQIVLQLATFGQKIAHPPKSCDCNLEGIIFDRDSAGTNVRISPNGRAVAKIHSLAGGEQTVLRIIHHDHGWLKVRFSFTDTTKTGWVYGRLVGLWLKGISVQLYQNPDRASRPVSRISSFYPGEESDHPVLFLGCQNGWAFVEAKDSTGRAIQGWLSPQDQCANPYTSCAP
jgi:hypothetical protein